MFDCFGKDACELRTKKLWLFDMDGTIYEEDRVFKGSVELLQNIVHYGGRYVFITNNSSKSVEDYLGKLKSLGIPADTDNFFTSAQAMCLYLKKNYNGKKIYCQGTRSFIEEFRKEGFDITEDVERVDLVIAGYDTELTYLKLRKTCEILSTQDTGYFATNPDLRCPAGFGFVPDCGSICSMIEAATGRKPVYIGKPNASMVDIIRERYRYTKDETVVIGDRLYTDIALGVNAGVTSVCVLTGETKIEDLSNNGTIPDYVFHGIWEIKDCLI